MLRADIAVRKLIGFLGGVLERALGLGAERDLNR
jgi:hypothetical protein